MRAMESSNNLRLGSDISLFLRDFLILYPLESLSVPGPLVYGFKNLACFWPSADNSFGNVTPTLPASPGWSQDRRYAFNKAFASHLPNISLQISKLRSTCAAAMRAGTTETLFFNDVDGPRRIATLFGTACNYSANELINMASPGFSFHATGGLRLWEDAANSLSLLNLPADFNIAEDAVQDSWISALRFNKDSTWFDPLATMMSKYCQFWKGSCSLAECSPNSSAAGSVRCLLSCCSNLFQGPVWSGQTGAHTNTQCGHADQACHYCLRPTANTRFTATTSIVDLPDAHYYAASTYQFNLAATAAEQANLFKDLSGL